MARITVEDCLQNVDNIFQLVILASQRARRLANGAEATVPWENDKATVVALREIAAVRPDSLTLLGEVKGVGASKLDRYGDAVLAVVAQNAG